MGAVPSFLSVILIANGVLFGLFHVASAQDPPYILHASSDQNHVAIAMLKNYIYAMTQEHAHIVQPASSVDFITQYQSLQANDRCSIIVLSNTPQNQDVLHKLFEQEVSATSKLWQQYFGEEMDKHNDSHSIHLLNHHSILCLGHSAANDMASHYCIFSLLQLFGVRFRIHGDVIPRYFRANKRMPDMFTLPTAFRNNRHWMFTPTFSPRGVQPFHDFAEGPDWWSHNEYKLLSEQLYKMKMDFQGYHTYPVREPLVWTGKIGEFDAQTGDVTTSYASSWMTTLGYVGGPAGSGGDWGGHQLNTSDYALGASLLYDNDCYSNEIQQSSYPNLCPYGTDMATYNDVFNNAGNLLNNVFNYAKLLGIKNCVGTETPMSFPPASPCQGPICPLRTYYSSTRQDHFVTTTPCQECGSNSYQFIRTEGWINLQETDVFNTPLSTCYDGSAQDNILVVGDDSTACPAGYGFVRVTGYASSINTTFNGSSMIPLVTYVNTNMSDHWRLANSSSITDAVDQGYSMDASAKTVYVLRAGEQPDIPDENDTMAYYEGIFSRIAAKYPIDYYWLWTPEGWEWQHVSVNDSIVNETITDINIAYQAMKRVNANFSLATCGWVIGPDGNRSYLDGYLPKDVVMSSIEMYLGQDPPDPAYANISKDRATWDIPWMEDDPDLTALQLWVNRTMSHIQMAKQYGVSGIMGIHWRTQEVSPQISALSMMGWNTSNEFGEVHAGLSPQTSLQFWQDWIFTEFNLTNASMIQSMATLFNDEIDSTHLPDSFNKKLPMVGCPGVLTRNSAPWSTVKQYYQFVDSFNAYKPYIAGAENIERFTYWSNMFEYLRMMGKVGVDWGAINGDKDDFSMLLNDTISMINYLMAAMSTKGTMGTLTNIQQQLIPDLLWPYKLSLPSEYTGVTRMWVLSPRSLVILATDSTQYDVQVMILSTTPASAKDITVHYRSLSAGSSWNTIDGLTQSGKNRQVYRGTINIDSSAIQASGFEYYLETVADSQSLRWPVANTFIVTVSQ